MRWLAINTRGMIHIDKMIKAEDRGSVMNSCAWGTGFKCGLVIVRVTSMIDIIMVIREPHFW